MNNWNFNGKLKENDLRVITDAHGIITTTTEGSGSIKCENEDGDLKIKISIPSAPGGNVFVDDVMDYESTNPVQNRVLVAEFDKVKVKVDDALNLNSTNPVQNKVIAAELQKLFLSVSNGKEMLAQAITDKGIPTDARDSFETMVQNISKIVSKGSINFIEYVDDIPMIDNGYRFTEAISSTCEYTEPYIE